MTLETGIYAETCQTFPNIDWIPAFAGMTSGTSMTNDSGANERHYL